jgi:hypothetical protein
MLLRQMETNEIDSVINLFSRYREDALISDEKYSENRVLHTIREYNIRPNLFFRIAVNGQRPVGLIGGFLSEDPVDIEVSATIQFCYLIEEFRDINNYKLMIDEFTNWGRQFKATNVRAIDIGNNVTRLQDVYEQLDFAPIRVSLMNRELV